MMKIWKRNAVAAAVLVLSFVASLLPDAVYAATPTDSVQAGNGIIRDNISISGVDVGGLTKEEALSRLGASASDATQVSLTSSYGDVVTTLGDLGLTDNTDEVIDEALSYGNSGTILQRFKAIEILKSEPLELELRRSIDETILGQMIENNIGSAMKRR